MTTPIPHWIATVSALLVPTVAVAAVCIARMQADTARKKLKLDLFDKRFAVFTVTRDTLAHVVEHQGWNQEVKQAYVAGTRGAKFLFDEATHRFLNEELFTDMHRYASLAAAWDQMDNAWKSKNMEIRNELGHQLAITMRNLDQRFYDFLKLEG